MANRWRKRKGVRGVLGKMRNKSANRHKHRAKGGRRRAKVETTKTRHLSATTQELVEKMFGDQHKKPFGSVKTEPQKPKTDPAHATSPVHWRCLNITAHGHSGSRLYGPSETTCRICSTKAPWLTAEAREDKKVAKANESQTDPKTATGPCKWKCLRCKHKHLDGGYPNMQSDRTCFNQCGTAAPWVNQEKEEKSSERFSKAAGGSLH